MKTQGQTIIFERDDTDWLLEQGKRHGLSRILPASSMDKLITQFRPADDGLALPWEATQKSVRFMPGKVSVWSGPSFAGKTALLRQLMLHAIARTNRRALFISLEEEPDEVWREFTCMAAHTRNPSPDQVRAAKKLFDGKLWVFDSDAPVDPDTLFGIVRFAVEKFGFSQVVIDSLMRLEVKTDDFNGQRELGNKLGRVAKLSRSHIHLVVHPRKTQNSRDAMDMYDIGGAQAIVAQADLVLTLERKFKAGEASNLLTLWKQRGDVNWIGKLPLWYDPASRQLKFSAGDVPEHYLPKGYVSQPAANLEPTNPREYDFEFPEAVA